MASNASDHKTSCIHVYDSLFDELDQESYDLMLWIFHGRTNNQRATIVMKELQKQTGSSDCGLFCIAVMTSLVHKEDQSAVKYDQSKMRQHLVDCYSSKCPMPFPKFVMLHNSTLECCIIKLCKLCQIVFAIFNDCQFQLQVQSI